MNAHVQTGFCSQQSKSKLLLFQRSHLFVLCLHGSPCRCPPPKIAQVTFHAHGRAAVLLRLIPAEKHAIRPSNAMGKNVINQNSATDYHDSPVVRSEVLMQVSFRKRGNDAQFKPISRELPCTHHEPMMIHNYLRTIQIDVGK